MRNNLVGSIMFGSSKRFFWADIGRDLTERAAAEGESKDEESGDNGANDNDNKRKRRRTGTGTRAEVTWYLASKASKIGKGKVE